MVRYQNHSQELDNIANAINDYKNSGKSQVQCASENNITMSVFRYYYHNATFMNSLNSTKSKKSPKIINIEPRNVFAPKPTIDIDNKKKTQTVVKPDIVGEKKVQKRTNIDINDFMTIPKKLP